MRVNPAVLNPADLRMDRSARPGWPTGAEELLSIGQHVYCTEGMAEVVRVLGKTGNGSRLLQLKLLDRTASPFHAAASNVLVAPGPVAQMPGNVLPAGSDWLI